MIGNIGTYGAVDENSLWTFVSRGWTAVTSGEQAAYEQIARERSVGAGGSSGITSGASNAPRSGDYVFNSGPDAGYTYRLDASGRVYIVRSPRTSMKSPQEVSTATAAGQSILKVIAANPGAWTPSPASAPWSLPTTSGGSTWAPPASVDGVAVSAPVPVAIDRPTRNDAGPLLLMAGIGGAVGLGLLLFSSRML